MCVQSNVNKGKLDASLSIIEKRKTMNQTKAVDALSIQVSGFAKFLALSRPTIFGNT